MNGYWELAANLVNAASIGLATLNSIHTWWTGIVGCVLFATLFFASQLYADATLQGFFIVTSVIGWASWAKGGAGSPLPVRRTPLPVFAICFVAAAAVALAYGWLLRVYTDAYAPFADSAVLALSVSAQLLLMRRRYESWWFWLAANSVSVPLFLSRGLILTALLYALFWVNAVVALVRWRRLLVSQRE
jgi:nicotinamide mononucleotide transporter